MAETPDARDDDDVDRPNEMFTSLTTPTKPKRHARPHRGIDVVPSSSFTGARFGRLFRNLPVFEFSDLELLKPLAQKMIPSSGGAPAENPDIPSGYTYLGQFVDHDITFDTVSSLQRQNDPDALHNLRTPRFDLDSLYGRGPADQPYMYDGVKLRLGESVRAKGPEAVAGPDLPRNQPRTTNNEANFSGRALIGDPRNDENLIVSQLHLTFLKFHNRVVDHVAEQTSLEDDNLFKEAQRLVRWHYQWVVVYDYLRRIVGEPVVDDILPPTPYTVMGQDAPEQVEIRQWRPRFYEPREEPYMPIEFSVAAFRFGHSMIRGKYHINTFLRDEVGAPAFDIFGDEELPANELANLNGFRRLPDDWGFEWQLFFTLPGATEAPQPSLEIDPLLAKGLADLPTTVATDPSSLAERNLLRGARLGLPSGPHVARRMGIEPLDTDELDLSELAPEVQAHPPLWYYVLREAKVRADGKRLGPVGGRIVAEVLLGLLAHDPLSYLRVEPNWRPAPPFADDDGVFGMPELIAFAQGSGG